MNGKMSMVAGAAVLLGLLGNVTKAQQPERISNPQRIVAFAEANKGKKVGNGQCADLVNAALKSVGARQLQIVPPHWWRKNVKEMYVWGGPYKYMGKGVPRMYPGDIVQFENCVFKSPNGAVWNAPHHTAIVKSMSGSKVVLLHQNDGVPVVTEREVDLSTRVKGGYMDSFYAVPKYSSGVEAR